MSNPNYPEGVTDADIDRIGKPLDGGEEVQKMSDREMENNRYKFRAWDLDNDGMFYTDGTNCNDGEWGKNWVIDSDGIHFEEYKLWHNTENGENVECEDWDTPNQKIMQCTGLKDENEKEIYEGDIIKLSEIVIDYVVFEEGQFKLSKCGSHEAADFMKSGEIIGNIYENPELLKREIEEEIKNP